MKARIVWSTMLALFLGAMTAPASLSAQVSDTSAVVLTMQPILTNLPSVGTGQPLGAAAAPVGVTRSMALTPVNIPAQNLAAGEGVGQTRALMGVGLASVIIGLIVGGDIGTLFVIGGGIIGLVGLYRYMQ